MRHDQDRAAKVAYVLRLANETQMSRIAASMPEDIQNLSALNHQLTVHITDKTNAKTTRCPLDHRVAERNSFELFVDPVSLVTEAPSAIVTFMFIATGCSGRAQ